MSKYEEIMEELDNAIEFGCDYTFLEEVKKELRRLRNENCQKCGRYKESHLGLCKDCRYEA